MTSGVPQGSVLGPLLFMDEVSSTGGLFADDCVIYRDVSHRSTPKYLNESTHSRFVRFKQYSNLIVLLFVISITLHFSTFSANCQVFVQFKIFSKSLCSSSASLIDTKLKWNNHCQSIAAKATRILNLLKRSMSGCNQHAKATAYQALVRPHLEYCTPVFDPHTVKNIEMLEKVQKRAARWLTAKWDNNSKQWDKSNFQSLSELNWQSLQQRRTYLNQCQTCKVLNDMDCIEFAKYWSYSGAQQTRFWHACTLQTVSSRVNTYRFLYLHHFYGTHFLLMFVAYIVIIYLNIS